MSGDVELKHSRSILTVSGDSNLTSRLAALLARSFPLNQARLTLANKVGRTIWGIVQATLYRYSPTVLHGWRCWLLRIFGATIGTGAHPCPRAKIWAPWNLTMGAHSCLGDHVDCYCVAPITLGEHATVSQYSYLCAASHDFRVPKMPLVVAPIVIERHAWVAASAFVGPGVRICEGSVVGARSLVMRDVPAWTVVAGSPAVAVGLRPRSAVPSLVAATTGDSIYPADYHPHRPPAA